MQITFEALQFLFANKTVNVDSLAIGHDIDTPFNFLVILHVGLWVTLFVLDRVLQHQHHLSQSLGYLEFFRETKELRRLPHSILSIGTVLYALYVLNIINVHLCVLIRMIPCNWVDFIVTGAALSLLKFRLRDFWGGKI